MSTAVTFEEIERNADRVTGYALLAKAAKNTITIIVRTYEILDALDKLLSVITPDRVEQLSEEQLHWVTSQLQKAHAPLIQIARSPDTEKIISIPVLGGLISRLQSRTEDLADLIQNLTLTGNQEFRQLVDACSEHLHR